MSYKVTTTSTRPVKNVRFFLMPDEHVTAVDEIIESMGNKVLDVQFETVGDKFIITRTFADEPAYQEFVERTLANPVIVKARADRTKYDEIYGIIVETKVE